MSIPNGYKRRLLMDNYYPRLRDLREDHDFSQQYRDVPTDVLIRLSKLYKTSTDYILGLTDELTPYKKR